MEKFFDSETYGCELHINQGCFVNVCDSGLIQIGKTSSLDLSSATEDKQELILDTDGVINIGSIVNSEFSMLKTPYFEEDKWTIDPTSSSDLNLGICIAFKETIRDKGRTLVKSFNMNGDLVQYSAPNSVIDNYEIEGHAG